MMRIFKSDTDYVIVEVEPPTTEMTSDFNGSVSTGFYVKFEFEPYFTTAYVWFPDGHKGGIVGKWLRKLNEYKCLQWCERKYGGGNEQGTDN